MAATNVTITADRASAVVGEVTSVLVAIEAVIAATGLGGKFNAAQVGQLTALLGNLAQVAIKAAHDAMGQEITPDSVLKLLPVTTQLADPK
jgi:hypothetical protein